jgi:hypothetical protein
MTYYLYISFVAVFDPYNFYKYLFGFLKSFVYDSGYKTWEFLQIVVFDVIPPIVLYYKLGNVN